jgi:hypothetical protein
MGGCNAFQFIDCDDAIPVFLSLLSPAFSNVEMGKFPVSNKHAVTSALFRGYRIN